ncbi:MAG: hypothetical protein FJ034_02490 [Chloroflexi bacterium]|nr:hypothetical protein [Chloroflexota bacterium]
MSAFALRVAAVVASLLVLFGGWGYAATHVKNPNAPLKPPVPGAVVVEAAPSAAPTPIPSLLNRPALRLPSSSPGPVFNLAPAVQTTALPRITITHVS